MASVRPPCEWTSPVLFKNVEITGLLSSNEISHGHRSKQGYSGQREERGLEIKSVTNSQQSCLDNEASIKTQKDGIPPASKLRKRECFHVPPCQVPSSTRIHTSLFRTSPYVSIYLDVDLHPLISFVINQ